jgi:hypothetical protein
MDCPLIRIQSDFHGQPTFHVALGLPPCPSEAAVDLMAQQEALLLQISNTDVADAVRFKGYCVAC